MSSRYGSKYSGMSKSQKKYAKKENAKRSKHEQKESNNAYRGPIMGQHSQVFKSGKDYDRKQGKKEARDWNDAMCEIEEEEEDFGF